MAAPLLLTVAFAAAGSTPPPSSPESYYASAEFQVDLLIGAVSPEERNKYLEEVHEETQTGIQECMSLNGFEYSLELFVPDHSSEVQTSPELAADIGFGLYVNLELAAPANADELDDLSAAEREAWQLQFAECQEIEFHRYEPDLSQTAQQEFEELLAKLETDNRVVLAEDDWRACMAELGYDYDSRRSLIQGLMAAGPPGRLADAEAWLPESPVHDEWLALVEQETTLAKANAQCFAPVAEIRRNVLAELRSKFLELWSTL